MKVLISDIAKKAGVSSGTVSNALNNRKGISQKKKEMILKIAEDMGYFLQKPNVDEANKKLRFIVLTSHGTVVGDTPFFSELIQGIEAESRILGYELIINYVDMELDVEFIDIMTQEAQGILVLGTELILEDIIKFNKIKLPIVFLDTSFRSPHFDTVAINNIDSVYNLVELIAAHGHKNVGLINSTFSINNFMERKLGFVQAVKEFDLIFHENSEIAVFPDIEGAYIGFKRYLTKKLEEELPTAFFAVNDNIAFGALRAVNELDLQSYISIVGFDDLPLAEFCTPSLTTIKVDKMNLGREAIQRLHYRINNKDVPSVKVLIETSLVKRNSLKIITQKM